MVVPRARAADAKVIRCPNCGAARVGTRPVCDFCGSRFTSVDTGWGLICPKCFCRLPNEAHFCVECGLAIQPEQLESIDSNLPCPRCQTPLQGRKLEKIEIHECGGCGGIWLATSTFDTLCRNEELLSSTTDWLDRLHPTVQYSVSMDAPVRYLPCPGCHDFMVRQNFARISGAIINLCRACGVWLDNQELNHIFEFIHKGGMQKAHEYEDQERHEESVLHPDLLAGPVYASAAERMLFSHQPSPPGSSSPLIKAMSWIVRGITE
jgi:Zn-finger nucleic acid-binding protein